MPVIESARWNGCSVALSYLGNKLVNQHELLVNGCACAVYNNKSVLKIANARDVYYVPCQVSGTRLTEVDVVIFYCHPIGYKQSIFIIPSEHVLCAYFADQSAAVKNKKLYLPTRQVATYRNATPRLNYWQYENAWHYCRQPNRRARSV